ncbi:MAG: hypothetical protein FWD13_11680 [Treponema sp.]|nr:hypothetical protein [Treponema sp.]
MKVYEQQAEYDELDINTLKEWLLKVNGECRAYIKGASEALIYAQENQGLSMFSDKVGFEN